ncbi:MAG TPA: TAXI family TRAP transporter solute-binding subunit [Bryobacteraceae bacterium]|nr:TAXI family TRAP transporter solute-binding subunit [Bryobacteraceae bacterium]
MAEKTRLARLVTVFTETFGLGRAAAISALLLIGSVTVAAVFWFFHSAPPQTITITSGPEGSAFQKTAESYRAILARSGVKLNVLPSAGSLENLKRLCDPAFHVDIGFVQGGVTNGVDTDQLVSLGSVAYEPLLVFYRSATPINLLSELNGKRLAIGPEGSGTRTLASALLQANGIEAGGATTLLDLDAEDAARALLAGTVDAVFLMSDSASTQTMRKLLRAPDVQLFDFTQADGYARRIHYLNKLQLPRGVVDFGKDIPPHDVNLVAPTVELVARAKLHPALIDLLLEAAREVHGRAALFQHRGEFPAPLEVDIHLSDEARRYYTSGKSFLYRSLPFWLASRVNRILVAFVPILFVLVPGLRLIPTVYRWQMRLRIYRAYRALLLVERGAFANPTPQNREELLTRLARIEKTTNKMKVPASFADQFYVLRQNIIFVRNKLMGASTPIVGEDRATRT